MDPVQPLLDQFRPRSEAEASWLRDMFTFIRQQVCPVFTGPAPLAAEEALTGGGVCSDVCVSLTVCVVKTLQENMTVTHTLPVSYRPVSVSELLSQQHLACVSHLSWSTNQQRAWAREAELCLPGSKALPRVNLLLIGCLRKERGGEWRLMDSSGSVRCECLSPSPQWLGRPVFLPHWNYIPHDASGQHEAGGWVELIGSPVLLCPSAEQGLAAERGVEPNRPMGVREAAGVLNNRVRGQRLSVCGQVSSVLPLLDVSGTTFFCFTLTEDRLRLPVLVKDSSRLWWSQCVCVGQSVCVTALRVCVLRRWRGNNILCVTDQSEIHTNYTPTHTPVDDTHSEPRSDTPPMMTSDFDDDSEGVEPEREEVQSGVRMKWSRVISYQGTVTEVVSEGAGLYVIDKTVGLMLCTCLRSSLRVTSFSRVGGAPPTSNCPCDGALPRLLVEKNMSVSEYLWTCHLSSQLSHSLVPSVLRQQQCVCVLSWKLMELVWRRGGRGGRRNIYSEMLDEPHTCPLTQYSVDPAVPQLLSVSELIVSLQVDSWSSVSLRSLLPPDGPSLSRSEINTALSWSYRTLTSDPQSSPQSGETARRRPLLLVGLLELPSATSEHTHTLQLRDGTASVTCVVTETSEEEGGQRAAFNTAWTGCLVCVHHFTMVTERFLQSDFPSYQHLDQDQFITHRHCRVYLQFSLDHVHILSPSAAMVTYLRHKKAESCDDITDEDQAAQRRRRGGDEPPCVAMTMCSVGGASRACVSMVIRVEQKEGVVLVFSGVCARWFPLLQSRCFYRLVAHSQRGVELHTDSTLQVQSDWRFHTLTRPPALQWEEPPGVPGLKPHPLPTWTVARQHTAAVCFPEEGVQEGGGVLQQFTCQLGDRRLHQLCPPPPPPMMHLGLWALGREGGCTVGQ
ncbi:hypothetical protein INR49_008939, partial [Caranx melampygus]